MPTQFTLPVIHPSFELLKRLARLLHLVAAALIFINALYHLQTKTGGTVFCYTQLIIAADIIILVFFGGELLNDAPRLNLIFRSIESLVLVGIAMILLSSGKNTTGFIYLFLSGSYSFLLYREWRVIRSEAVDICPTGITIPNLAKDTELGWNEIRSILPHYHSIIIKTLRNKTIRFQLRKNLKIEELQQIDEFCQKHLVS
jgi:hypothetical protein